MSGEPAYAGEMDDIVRRAIAGDTRAFERLVQETTPSVRTVVRSYIRNPDDAADVMQEVYLRALQRLDTLDDPTRFKSWLYAIARNAGLDHLRKAKRRPLPPPNEIDHIDQVESDPGPEDLAEVRELAEQVQLGAARLSARDTTLLAMVTTLGFTPTDVAGALGMSHTAAKVAVHRARQRLRNAMLLESTMPRSAVTGDRCEELGEVIATGNLIDAALHARSCARCGTTATARARSSA